MAEIQISLAAARVNAGMTQEKVAKEMHVSKNTIVNWEKGTSEPTINQGKELAQKEDNIIFGGRLGEYKYYDMDAVIASALEMSEKELV